MKKDSKLTSEQIQAKADELQKQYGLKITPIVFEDPDTGEQIIGYLKEPNRLAKTRILDKAMGGLMVSAAQDLLELTIIPEASDPRIMSDLPENDRYNLGAAMAAQDLIKFAVNTFKKK
ncbi:hypothetical protein ACTJJB_01555 [Chitinophaga sp. 22536]|uniref:hypothetical protein n=1 Tax=unclassified Chitinophaga TaxID=2619133 RepID=UPI003F85CA07